MKPNELRIGNWYNWRGGDALDEGYNEQMKGSDYAELLFNPERFRAIPLTEEWLLKFGFENNFSSFFEKRLIHTPTAKISISIDFNSYEVCQSGCGFQAKIRNVHQLQNLYFALTGKELKVGEA